MKHTPGNWAMGCYEDGKIYVYDDPRAMQVGYKGPINTIAEITDEEVGSESAKSNAQLIAAAPDLLAALKSFPGFYGPSDSQWIAWCERRIRAIAKAEAAGQLPSC